MLPELHLHPGARVLDFGAGTCWMSRLLALLGCEVTAVDVSRKALEVRERLIRADPLGDKLACGSFRSTDLICRIENDSFDRVRLLRLVRITCWTSAPSSANSRACCATTASCSPDEARPGAFAIEPDPYGMRMFDVIERDVHVDPLFEAARELRIHGSESRDLSAPTRCARA